MARYNEQAKVAQMQPKLPNCRMPLYDAITTPTAHRSDCKPRMMTKLKDAA